MWSDKKIARLLELWEDHSYTEIAKILTKEFKKKVTANGARKAYERYKFPTLEGKKLTKPKILVFDIETLPIEAYVWGLHDQNVGLNMIKEDWSVLSWAAKWYGEDEIFYEDVRKKRNVRDDKQILKGIWKLLDEADYVVGQNSNSFDIKKLNSRFILHGMQPPSSYKKLDTLRMARKDFKFTSNKLAYLSNNLCSKYEKLSHGKYPGFSMWSECMKGNQEAFDEMEEYNRMDILSTEELFDRLLPWSNATLFNIYHESEDPECSCGSTSFKESGFYYTNAAKYQKYRCSSCGAEYRDKENLLSKNKKKSLKNNCPR